MADNITVNQGSGGATIRAENTAGNLFVPVTKIHNGADDTDGGSITATNPFAVQLSQGNTAVAASNPVPVVNVNATSGGDTIGKVLSAGSTNATSLKASAGQVYEYDLYNNAAYAVFIHFYNKASAPTVGTDVPVFTIGLAATSGRHTQIGNGLPFATGIAYAITKGAADTDSVAVLAADVTGFIGYK